MNIIELYRSGLTYATIAELVGQHPETVRRNLNKAGVEMREYRDYYAAQVNEQYFDVIDSQEKAYWLGFIAADGCISQSAGDYRAFHFVLQRADRQALVNFKQAISYSGEVHDFEQFVKHRNKSYTKSGIWFNNKAFCACLLAKGMLGFKKEDKVDLFDHVPPELFRHFVRGFFDGDGCISRNRHRFKSHYINFAGTERILIYLEGQLSSILGLPVKGPKKSKTSNIWSINWNGNRQVRTFGQWIYENAVVYLDRKKNRFDILDAYYNIAPVAINPDNSFTYPLPYKEIAKLSQPTRQKLADQLFQKLWNRPWVPPQYSTEELLLDYDRIKQETDTDYLTDAGLRSRKISFVEFAGRKLLVHHQPHYWETRYKSHKTIVEGWSDEAVMRKAISNLFETRGARPSLARLFREMNFAGARRISHFHPGLAKAILHHYAPSARSYFDPCAGWGARLLAASVLGLQYTACDPNYKTVAGLHNIAELVGFQANIHPVPFEEFSMGEYDVIFTSPPYFNTEKYEFGAQSYKGVASYDEWYTKFMSPMVEKCLKRAPIVIFHVSVKIKDSIVRDYGGTVIPVFMQKTPGGAQSAEYLVMWPA